MEASKSYREDTKISLGFSHSSFIIYKDHETHQGNIRNQMTQSESTFPDLNVSGTPKFCVKFHKQWCHFLRYFHILW